MRLSFLPGDLHLTFDPDQGYVVRLGETVLLTTNIERHALGKFKAVRQQLETRFPPTEASSDDKRRAFLRELLDSQVKHNSLREEPRKRPAKTRTFG